MSGVTGALVATLGAAAVPGDVLINSTRLDCGVVVVTERMPDVRSVSAGFWVGTGSRDEAPGVWGASHFLEHLLFKGTPTRSSRSIAEDVDAVGGDFNAFTTKEFTAFEMRLLHSSLELGLDILSDIVWNPALRSHDVESERQVILEEILMRADEPADLVHEVFADAMFPLHPLGREVLGDQSSIEAMTREDIASFHGEHYRSANVVFAAAGRLEHEAVVQGVERRFGGGVGHRAPVRRGPSGPQPAVAVDRRATEQVHLVVGTRALDRHDEDRYTLAVLNHTLGGGPSSRLFQAVREERGLAYCIYSYRLAFQDTGALGVYAGTMPSKVDEVLEVVAQELDTMARDGITSHELEVAKGHLVGDLALSLEDSGARMDRIGRSQLVHGHVPEMEEVMASIEAVTLEDTARIAGRILGDERVLAVVGPVDEVDQKALTARRVA
ncbi:MAG: insulinase family protein [Actinomycetota bacterium]|nr:insulinase family protein [Actinomycetota bacterium]